MSTTTGAEAVRWDLSDLYTGIDDPALEADLQAALARAAAFAERYRGRLADDLGDALDARARLSEALDKLGIYLFLQRSTDATNERIQQRLAQVQEAWSQADADHLTFFDHEVAAIPADRYQALCDGDERVRHHQTMLDRIRNNARYLLDEPIERALTLRSPFGPSEWADYADEWEAELRFELDGKTLTMPEILHITANDPDRERRARALGCFSAGMRDSRYDRFMARTLNAITGAKAVEDRERGYATPMSARNLDNMVDDDTVEALHQVVAEDGAAQCRRYYRLLSAHLGVAPLRWSDRNAPLPFADTRTIPWSRCVDTVLEAYGTFSPTLRKLVSTMIDRRWIDAPPAPGKVGGAFNYSVCLPGGETRAYNFLNYLGSTRDVVTVAHELGHGVHGLLAGEAQGPLLFRAPMAYAETASIFGEMTTFQFLLANAERDEERLALLMGKANDFLNTVVRQISFSNFERGVHDRRRRGKLTLDELCELWMEVTRAFYGADGDVFTYEHTANLWAYVSHFHRPFYVYAYAFGELFTQSLYTVRERFGAEFEPMYLDMLRAGGSKDAIALMAPFGLDPRDPTFWKRGIAGSVTVWLDQAEEISARLGVKVQ
jgi:oligoendopeptidase F